MMAPAPARRRVTGWMEGNPDMATAIGVALVVISALEIWLIIRVVSANLNLRS
jgi:uncharacterized membrane protein